MSWRFGLAAAGLLAFFGWSLKDAPGLVRLAWETPTDFVDEVSRYDQRFQAVKAELPPRGVVGYRAELQRVGDEELFFYTVDGLHYSMHPTRAFFLTQYALAPVIVERRAAYPLVIDNRRTAVRLATRDE